MKFREIEVSGIECIVFNRKHVWRLIEGELWEEKLLDKTKRLSHKDMMVIVNALKRDRRYRMWIHFDTLNIVRSVRRVWVDHHF